MLTIEEIRSETIMIDPTNTSQPKVIVDLVVNHHGSHRSRETFLLTEWNIIKKQGYLSFYQRENTDC